MDKDIAQKLFNELSKHEGIIKPEENIFLRMLENFEIKKSSKFYEDLPLKEQTLNELSQERYSILSLRRIMRNINAEKNSIKGLKKYWTRICSALKIYSSTDLTRKLRGEGYLINLMEESGKNGNLFSLLGKIEECDWSNQSGKLYRRISPVLIIPGFINNIRTKTWEDKNSVYEKEILMFKRRISKKEYLFQGAN